jgi:hypothetical protein
MDKKFNFQKLISGIGIAAIALVGSLIGAPASNAVTTSDDVETWRTVSRSAAVINVNGSVTDTISIAAGEKFQSYYFSVVLADNSNNLTLASAYTPSFTATVTKDGAAVNLMQGGNYGYANYTNSSNQSGSWNNSSQSGIPAGTYRDLRYDASFGPSMIVSGPATISITFSITNGASVLTPLSFSGNTSTGADIQLPRGGSYTATANDKNFYINYEACIWAADHSIAAGDQINFEVKNGSSTMSYSYGDVNDSAENMVSSTTNGTGKRFNFPASNNDIVRVGAWASLINPTGTITPTLDIVKNGTTTQLFDKCNRYTSIAAPTVTGGSNSVTLNWTAPANLGSSGWTNVLVLACTTSLATCADQDELSRGFMGPDSRPAYSLKNSQAIAASATSYTVSASNMNSMFMSGPSSNWNGTTQYKYYVIYFKANQYYMASAPFFNLPIGNLAISAVSGAANASGSVTPSLVAPVTAQVVRLPEWQNKAINSITKVIDQSGVKLIGGKIKLDGVTASDLKKVTLNGKEISVESLNPEAPVLNIPAGAGTGDLVFTLANGGTWTFQNAVRYVEPIKAGKPMKLFNFDNGSTTVNSYQIAQIAAQTADLMRGSTVECFGYVAKKNANTVARATAQAEAICAEALKINPALKKVITIGVDEIMALQPNRIRVFG